jgi:hypothetical protein
LPTAEKIEGVAEPSRSAQPILELLYQMKMIGTMPEDGAHPGKE